MFAPLCSLRTAAPAAPHPPTVLPLTVLLQRHCTFMEKKKLSYFFNKTPRDRDSCYMMLRVSASKKGSVWSLQFSNARKSATSKNDKVFRFNARRGPSLLQPGQPAALDRTLTRTLCALPFKINRFLIQFPHKRDPVVALFGQQVSVLPRAVEAGALRN